MTLGSNVDVTVSASKEVGPTLWLYAFLQNLLPSPKVVQLLLDAGCDINETVMNHPDIPNGWNCLFLQSLQAWHPEFSHEFQTLRLLLRQGISIFARDTSGKTIFDHVNAPATSTSKFSRYSRDLWYCALRREGVDLGQGIEVPSGVTGYGRSYTPEHYRALCYLDTWSEKTLSRQLYDTLKTYPWTEEETLELFRVCKEKEREEREAEIREREYQGMLMRLRERQEEWWERNMRQKRRRRTRWERVLDRRGWKSDDDYHPNSETSNSGMSEGSEATL
jgi:hypothetical protein